MMMKRLVTGAALSLALGAHAWSQSCPAYPNALSNGTTADALQVMGNFDTIMTCVNGLAPLANPPLAGIVTVNNSSPSTGSVLSITPTGSAWNEGIEINPAPDGYSGLAFRTTANSTSSTWELFMANTADGSGSHSLGIAMNGLTGMSGTGRVDTPFSITTSGVSRFGGDVGIGNTTPTDMLDVGAPVVFGGTGGERLSLNSGSIGFNRKVVTGQIYNPSYYAYQFQHFDSTSAASDYLTLQVYAPNGSGVTNTAWTVNGEGDVTVGGGTSSYLFYVNGSAGGLLGWNVPSDGRLKTNVQEVTDGIDTVMRLRPVTFEWRAPEEHPVGKDLPLPERVTQVGFIAQEVEAVVPEAVVPPKPNHGDTYGMRADALIPYLVEAVKEEQGEIADLRAEVAALKAHRTAPVAQDAPAPSAAP